MNHDVLQIIGALLVLAGFFASQVGWLSPKSLGYLVLNILGAAILAWLAWLGSEWGFLLLEGVWTIVSVVALITVLASSRSRSLEVSKSGRN